MPQEEENRAIVRRLFEALNSGDDASLDQLVTPDCEIIGPAGSGRGPAIYRQVFGMLRAAFPDIHVAIDEMLAAEGDRVIVRTRTSGTHRGVFMGIAPTDKPVSWPGVNFLHVRAGRIASSWGLQDRLAVLEHLGVSPTAMRSGH
jgi:steroid delta-isomerase-like uncharacterized protein